MIKKLSLLLTLFVSLTMVSCGSGEHITNTLRAPAYPLITIDPYTSAWSTTDNLYDSQVKHWTGKDFQFMGVARVDGKLYRFMGQEEIPMQGIAPISYEQDWEGAYTFSEPKNGWQNKDFNDRSWKRGKASFGTPEQPNHNTAWNSHDIWVRRTIEFDPNLLKENKLFVKYSHDDTFQLYFNGEQIVSTPYEWMNDRWIEIPAALASTAKDGKVVLAAHCENRTGGALVDLGLYAQAFDAQKMGQTAKQLSVDVQATRTIYNFACGEVDLKLTFTAPLLLEDPDLVSRPINYVSYDVTANDGKTHNVELYFEAGPNWSRNTPDQKSATTRYYTENHLVVSNQCLEQKILGRKGDDVRIDWGQFNMAISADENNTFTMGDPLVMRNDFASYGKLISKTLGEWISISTMLGEVSQSTKSGYLMVGYDDYYSIRYFNRDLFPYWNRRGDKTYNDMLDLAAAEYDELMKRCEKFDNKLMADATKSGGKKYAELCALAYRQAISAHKLVETPEGEMAWLSKENFSNGSIGTVDVTYPSAPLFLYYNPEFAKGLLNHIFYYSESGKWTKPFAAHDVGTYPHANGQTYGGDMPVEECGNMLILTGAICQIEGKADYALKHWDVLTTWTDYLVEHGGDPENQLCTDDFAGHWARNANLAIKAIEGIAAYGDLAKMAGKKDIAQKYTAKAKEMAAAWKKMAEQGDHYRLTFNEGDTWSQKYNLVWDKILGYNVFDEDIAAKEIPYYLTKQNEYGLPLDCRKGYTKSDWIIWSATMSPDKATFEKFIDPLHKFYSETTDRIPMSDWYNTDSKTHVGFRARSVVGGYWIKMLSDRMQ